MKRLAQPPAEGGKMRKVLWAVIQSIMKFTNFNLHLKTNFLKHKKGRLGSSRKKGKILKCFKT